MSLIFNTNWESTATRANAMESTNLYLHQIRGDVVRYPSRPVSFRRGGEKWPTEIHLLC